jgi:hypothetical protein
LIAVRRFFSAAWKLCGVSDSSKGSAPSPASRRAAGIAQPQGAAAGDELEVVVFARHVGVRGERQGTGHAQVDQQTTRIAGALARAWAEWHPQVFAAPGQVAHLAADQAGGLAAERPAQRFAQRGVAHLGAGDGQSHGTARDFHFGQFGHEFIM